MAIASARVTAKFMMNLLFTRCAEMCSASHVREVEFTGLVFLCAGGQENWRFDRLGTYSRALAYSHGSNLEW